MDSTDQTKVVLSVVTPFHRITDLKNISSWIPAATEVGIEVVLVLDSLSERDISLVTIELRKHLGPLKVSIGNFGSAARSRNVGITLASGEWITFWDADDRPIPRNFTQMIAESMNCSIAKGSFSRKTGKDNQNKKSGEIRVEAKTLRNIYTNAKNPGLWRWAFRREILKDTFFPEVILGEDQLFLIEALSKVNEYFNTTSFVYEYNDSNSGSISNTEYRVSNFIQSAKYSVRRIKEVRGAKTKFHLYIFTIYQLRSTIKAYLLGKR